LEFFGDMDLNRFIARRGEALFSSEVFAKALRDNIGEVTFLEAFDRTGRTCNITVSGLPGTTELPMLLNYLTSPHVLIWSAAVASAAVPGIFEPRELLMKDREGNVVPYYPGGLKWRDGSMQNDLPMTRLTELFNVNFFIVSQVNPHAMLISGAGLGSNRGPVFRCAQFLRRELKQYLLSISDLVRGTSGRVSPWLRPVGYSAVGMLVQEYEGDITIWNGSGMLELPYLLENGTTELLHQMSLKAERETWWSIPQIENSCKIEFVMEEILKQLREEMIRKPDASGGLSTQVDGPLMKRMISKDVGMKRLPSFHRDLLQRQEMEELPRHDRSGSDLREKLSAPDLAGGMQRKQRKRTSHLFASSQSLLGLMASTDDHD
jgi:predicted acylesterase/phospholipase RssA